MIGSMGLYFQWARKDPFIYPDVIFYESMNQAAPKLVDMKVYDEHGP